MDHYYLCDSCGHKEGIELRMRVYEEGYSGEVRPTSRVGWCRGCSRVVEIEYVPSMKEFEEELAIIEKKALLPFHSPEWLKLDAEIRFAPWGPEWARATIAEYMRWRSARKNPSRCFECGSFEVSLLANDPYSPIPCLKCGGKM